MHHYAMPVAPVFRTFVQYLISFSSRLEAASDVVSDRIVRLADPDKCAKCCNGRYTNRSPEIRVLPLKKTILMLLTKTEHTKKTKTGNVYNFESLPRLLYCPPNIYKACT